MQLINELLGVSLGVPPHFDSAVLQEARWFIVGSVVALFSGLQPLLMSATASGSPLHHLSNTKLPLLFCFDAATVNIMGL